MRLWIENATGYWLQDPAWLWLSIAVPIALLLRWRGSASALPFAPLAIYGDAIAPRSWRQRLRYLPTLLITLAIFLGIIALARPVERVPVPNAAEGLEILLCLDRSSSMLSNDLEAARTRREVAIEAAARFVAVRPDDRIGLLGFARYADLICPPTLDHSALVEALRNTSSVIADGPEDATGIGAAVAEAAQRLVHQPASRDGEHAERVVILFTDGEENVALAGASDEISPQAAAQLCADQNIKVYAIAAGQGRRAQDGSWIDLDTKALEQMATQTGGRSFRARRALDVGQVFAAIDRLERGPLSAPEWRAEPRFYVFLLPAIALVFAACALAHRWLRTMP